MLLTVAEAAVRLQVTKRALWNAIQKGSMPVFRVGPYHSVRIDEDVLKREKESGHPYPSMDIKLNSP
jgi:excisionase family DNA binding protein